MHTPKWEACRVYYFILTGGGSNIFYILLLRGNESFKILRQLQNSSLVTSFFFSGDAEYLAYIACWNFIYFIKQIGKKRLHGQIHLGASRVKFINREVS